jgi:4-hydroxy-2-oxoglutarate aldolase
VQGGQRSRGNVCSRIDAFHLGAFNDEREYPHFSQDGRASLHLALTTVHRKQVADQSPIPVMIYNFPTVTAGQNLKSDIIGELAKHPNIVGTKLSCGDLGKAHRLATLYGKGTAGATNYGEFATFPGKSDVFLPGLLMASHGIIGALVNLAPKAHAELYRLQQKGELKEALEIQTVLSHADAAVSNVGGIGGMKKAISRNFGYGGGHVRGPLAAAKEERLDEGEDAEWIRRCVELEKSLY